MKKRNFILLFLLVTLILPVASAGIIEWFKEKLQLSPSQPTDITIQVQNQAPNIVSITNLPSPSLVLDPSTTSLTTAVNFEFVVEDQNGVDPLTYNDLNDNTATATFTKGTETRTDAVCDRLLPSTSSNQRTYYCSIDMNYYDEPGIWSAAISITDRGSNTATDTSSTFNVGLSLHISVTAPTFNALTQGQTTTSTTDTTITNNGNAEVPANVIKITPRDLTSAGVDTIPATAFRVGSDATVCTSGTPLTGSGLTDAIAGLSLPRDPLLTNSEDIKYCVSVPAGITSGSYSATVAGGNPWTILIATS